MANFKIQNVRIQLKHDTAANWEASHLIPLAGELCLDTTNNVIKIGDGVNEFSGLPNAGSVITNASAYSPYIDEQNPGNPGGIDAEHGGIKVNGKDINVYTLNPASASKLGGFLAETKPASLGDGTLGNIYIDTLSNKAYVEYVKYADQLKTTRTVGLSGDATGNTTTDFSGTTTIPVTLNETAIASDFTTEETTASKKRLTAVEVDKKGRVVGSSTLTTADITNAVAASTGTDDASKAIKTNASGLLDDTFLSEPTRTDAAVNNSATVVITGITSDAKGRVTATTSMEATNTGAADNADDTAKTAVAGKLVKANANGKVDDTFLKATGVVANDGSGAAPYTAVKVDAKGRVVAGTTAGATIAKDKRTIAGENEGEEVRISQLGFVTSDYDDAAAVNSDDNKGKVAIDASGNMTVTRVDEADKLHTARTIAFAESAANAGDTDVTGSLSFDGSQNVTTQLKLVDKFNVGAGNTTKRVVVANVDAKGRVVSDGSLLSSDVSDAVNTKGAAAKVIISDASGELADSFLKGVTRNDTASENNSATSVIASITSDEKGRVTATTTLVATATGGNAKDSGKLVKLGNDGKLDDSIIPAIALTDTYVVNDITARDALTGVQVGDIAIVTNATADEDVPEGGATYIVKTVSGNTITWTRLKTPTDVVDSVNGKTGAVVLTTSDIAEGTNKYYTSERATIDANKAIAGGFYLLDCGGASGENAATVKAKTFIDPATGVDAVQQNQGN